MEVKMIPAQKVAVFLARPDVCVKIDGFDVVIRDPDDNWSARGLDVPSVARLAILDERRFKAVCKANAAVAKVVKVRRESELCLEIGALVLQSKKLQGNNDDFVSLEILKEAGRTLRDLLEETVSLGES
jgi:hypothetical protein